MITAPLAQQIVSQAHEPPDDAAIRTLQQNTRKERDESLHGKRVSRLPYLEKRRELLTWLWKRAHPTG